MSPAADPREAKGAAATWRPLGDLIHNLLRRTAGADPARLAMIAALFDGGAR